MADVGKQMNQAGTLLVAAELALAGVPVLIAKLGGRLLSKPDGQGASAHQSRVANVQARLERLRRLPGKRSL